jgi:hypothetical protein
VSTKFTDIRDRVYQKLNDSDYGLDPASPSVASLAQVGHTINEVLREIVLTAERLGYYPLAKKGAASLSVVAGMDTYDIYTTWPDYRARLTLVRTDTSKPVPMYWPEGGDYQAKQWLAMTGYLFGMDLTWPGHRARAHDLVLMGRDIVFVIEPTQAMTLAAYYLPTIPQFANVTESAPAVETLADLELECLEDHTQVLVKMIVNDIRPDLEEAVTQAMLVSQLRSSEAFVRAMRDARGGPVRWRWKSRWLSQNV